MNPTNLNNKRNNYVDGQYVDIDDFQTEQNYFLQKTRDIAHRLGLTGVSDLTGLKVVPDPVVAEPISFSAVAVAIPPTPNPAVPNPNNYTEFPLTASTTNFSAYTVFKTTTKNIQRIDLRITLAQAIGTENLNFNIYIKSLVDPTNPKSPLANVAPLAQIKLSQPEIPSLDSDSVLQLDFSNENSGQGIAVLLDSYYAISLELVRPQNSTAKVRVFHNPIKDKLSLDPTLYSWVVTSGGLYSQDININSLLTNLQIYHKVYTSAVKITAGTAQINGAQIDVEEDQFRFLEIPDRRNVDQLGRPVANYVLLRYNEVGTDPDLIPATKNTVNTRIKDSATTQVLTQPQWDALLTDSTQNNNFILLATVTDSNIVSISSQQTFAIPGNNTRLAFHDWLNPSNTIPNTEADAIKQARPNDFVFYVSNVPSKVPLTDANGIIQRQPNNIKDQFGNLIVRAGDPIYDDIVRVAVALSLDNGKNVRIFELAIQSEIGVGKEFRNYAATISDLSDNPLDNVFSFKFGTDQIAPNATYNFIAYTTRGLPVYIQDYNAVLKTRDRSGQIASLRQDAFTVFLDQNTKTATINADLQLGAFDPTSDGTQSGVVQYVPTLIKGEVVTPVGTAGSEQIQLNRIDYLSSDSFAFGSVPMVRANGTTKILNNQDDINAALAANDIEIFVDGYNITHSGRSGDKDRGGDLNDTRIVVAYVANTSPILSMSDLNLSDANIKTRNSIGRDNTKPNTPHTYISNERRIEIICCAKSTTSNAGFQANEKGFLYINNQPALDVNRHPIDFTFTGNTTITIEQEIMFLGDAEYFGEKIIKAGLTTVAQSGEVLIDTGLDSLNSKPRLVGRLIFNAKEIPTDIRPNAEVTIKFNATYIQKSNILYYRTKFTPIGTRNGYKIVNSDTISSADEFISVPEAFAQTSSVDLDNLAPSTFQSVAIFVDGLNINSPRSPIGQKTIVPDDGRSLAPGQVAFNPDLGYIKFAPIMDSTGTLTTEAPEDFTSITIAYFRLDTKFIFNSMQGAVYDSQFDLNNDGRIDEADLSIFMQHYNTTSGVDANFRSSCDFNGDGKVDSADLNLFRTRFGTVQIGEPNFVDATTARLNSLLVVRSNNHLRRIKVVKAVSRAPDALTKTGKTILFFDDSTPVTESGEYTISFGFQALLSLGYAQTVEPIKTVRPLLGKFNLNNITMFETSNPTNRRQITTATASQIAGSDNLYENIFTFAPAIPTTSTWTVSSIWNPSGLAIFDRTDLTVPQKYEQLDRKLYGPFKLDYSPSDYQDDGTQISFKLKATDATMSDGRPDPTGTHIQGIPLSELTFTVHLTVPNTDGTSTIWTWHQLQPFGLDNKITIGYNQFLFIDHRSQGLNGASVLSPFGLGSSQVALKPQFAGGTLRNDLSNISVVRNNESRYPIIHDHTSERQGGLLTSRSVRFTDELARLSTGNLTDVIYKLLDLIQEQNQQIQLLRAIEGIVRWDAGFYWDDPNLFYDQG